MVGQHGRSLSHRLRANCRHPARNCCGDKSGSCPGGLRLLRLRCAEQIGGLFQLLNSRSVFVEQLLVPLLAGVMSQQRRRNRNREASEPGSIPESR